MREPDNATWLKDGIAFFGCVHVSVAYMTFTSTVDLWGESKETATALRDDLTAALAWAQRQEKEGGKH